MERYTGTKSRTGSIRGKVWEKRCEVRPAFRLTEYRIQTATLTEYRIQTDTRCWNNDERQTTNDKRRTTKDIHYSLIINH